MEFEKVTKQHILQGITDFEEKGMPKGFGPSNTYDLLYKNSRYPPPAIMAYAFFHAEDKNVEPGFRVGKGSECFETFERNGFNVVKKENKAMNEKLYALKEKFLKNWPIEKLEQMSLEEYTDTERNNSFCYWLEHKTRDLGSIVGGSSYKFGIYKIGEDSKTESASNRDNDGLYAWHTKYGNTAAEAFGKIKSLIVHIAKLATNNEINSIDSIDLGDGYKWKIAFLYSDFGVVNIFKKEALRFVANSMFKTNQVPEAYGALNGFVVSKKGNEDFFAYTKELWELYDKYNSKAEEFKKWLKAVNKEKSNKNNSYINAIKILITVFKIEVYTETDINVLKELYEDLIVHQKDQNGKYAYEKKSYGEKGFYSAAIKSYIQFLTNDSVSIVSEESESYKGLMNEKLKISPLNQILYGPPGTGKTYSLKKHYIQKYVSNETSLTKEKHFENVVKECSWWQVIAIALLELGKSKVNDIFENKWVQQKAILSSSKTVRPTLWGQLQSHTIENCEYVNVKSRQSPLIFNKDENSYWEILESDVRDQSPELFDLIDSIENFNPRPDKIIKRYKFVTFHQSFSYEDFIEGIKPILPEGEEVSGDLGYKIENGVFKDLCIDAKNDPENQYAIFIDEINRGNVSAIFGELITLIETDKRTGCENEIQITLPYSKEEFSVPSNVDIYGTMNTADRSVEALDTALRRRFSFKEMMPDYEVISHLSIEGIDLKQVLKIINDRIELLVDRDHTIGHSYFIDIKNPKKLANAFNDKIIPLLQEYFYGDYGKIGLVLGEGFVEKTETKNIAFAKFKYDDSEDFKTPKYNLIKANESNIIGSLKILLGQVEEPSVI